MLHLPLHWQQISLLTLQIWIRFFIFVFWSEFNKTPRNSAVVSLRMDRGKLWWRSFLPFDVALNYLCRCSVSHGNNAVTPCPKSLTPEICPDLRIKLFSNFFDDTDFRARTKSEKRVDGENSIRRWTWSGKFAESCSVFTTYLLENFSHSCQPTLWYCFSPIGDNKDYVSL